MIPSPLSSSSSTASSLSLSRFPLLYIASSPPPPLHRHCCLAILLALFLSWRRGCGEGVEAVRLGGGSVLGDEGGRDAVPVAGGDGGVRAGGRALHDRVAPRRPHHRRGRAPRARRQVRAPRRCCIRRRRAGPCRGGSRRRGRRLLLLPPPPPPQPPKQHRRPRRGAGVAVTLPMVTKSPKETPAREMAQPPPPPSARPRRRVARRPSPPGTSTLLVALLSVLHTKFLPLTTTDLTTILHLQ